MIRYLKTFATAAELGSFSNAGMRLGLTQSAVSMQIKRLEDDLNCQLFDRMGKSIALSEHGRELLPTAHEILALYSTMKGQTDATQTRGKINLGAISTVQLGLLPGTLSIFRTHLPLVEINVVPGTSVQLMSQIDSNELGIAVMIKPNLRITKGLRWTTLMRETYVAIAADDVEETSVRELLANHPFIRYSRRSYGGQLVDRFLKRSRLNVNDTMELDEPAVILEMVRKGLGVAIIPFDLAASEARTGVRFLSLEGTQFYREIGILERVSQVPNISTSTLVESLIDTAARKVASSKKSFDLALANERKRSAQSRVRNRK